MEYFNSNIRTNISFIKKKHLSDIETIFDEASKSVCQIEFKVKYGSGFLIKFEKGNKPFYCLMSCYSIINKYTFQNEGSITIYYNRGNNFFNINMNKEKRFYKDYRYINVNAIVIQILPQDNIEESFFLRPCLKNINDILNEKLYILEYPKEGHQPFLEGKIKSVTSYEFCFLTNKCYILAGSPIIILSNNILSVIGICIKMNKNDMKKYANFINPIVDSLRKNLNICKVNYYEDIYIGEYEDINREGYGKYIRKNKSYYIGQWQNDYEHGKGAIYSEIYSNNNYIIYEGDFKEGKPNGIGKCVYDNGNYYIGEFLNGIRHGKGTIYYKNNNIKYEGDFVEDRVEGNGKYIWENGEYYIGQFFNNLRHGKGIEYYNNNNIEYDGDFVMNKYEGNGKFYWKNWNYYVGQWLNGLKHGKGKIYSKDNIIIYDGFFVNGEKSNSEMINFSINS